MAPKGTNLALVINVCDGLEKYLHFIIRTKVALSFYLYNSVCLFAYSFVHQRVLSKEWRYIYIGADYVSYGRAKA